MDCVHLWANRSLVNTEFNARDLTRALGPLCLQSPTWLTVARLLSLVSLCVCVSVWIVENCLKSYR